MQKNVAGQKWTVFAFDTTDNTVVTADATNITCKVSADDGVAAPLTDVNPTEVEDGYYVFDLTQAETNYDKLHILPESSTANVQVVGVPGVIYTNPINHADLAIGGSGRVESNLKVIDGSTASMTALKAFADLLSTGKLTTASFVADCLNNSLFADNVFAAEQFAASALDDKGNWLQPTTTGRTLDVTATGAAGIDWGNVENTGSTVGLSATTVDTVTTNTDMRGTDGASTHAPTAVWTSSDMKALADANVGTPGEALFNLLKSVPSTKPPTGSTINTGSETSTYVAAANRSNPPVSSTWTLTTSGGGVLNADVDFAVEAEEIPTELLIELGSDSTITDNIQLRARDSGGTERFIGRLVSLAPEGSYRFPIPEDSIETGSGVVQITILTTGAGATENLDMEFIGVGVRSSAIAALNEYDPPTRTEATSDKDEILSAVAGLNDIDAAAIWSAANIVEGTYTPAEFLNLVFSVLLGKSSGFSAGSGGTGIFRDAADAKDRISVTHDANGNRTTINTLDAT